MELLRFSLWGNTVITPAQTALSWVLTLLAVLAGTLLFNHVERVFADTV
jgi:ABC-type polysaccharide/polyol phosphate export permease